MKQGASIMRVALHTICLLTVLSLSLSIPAVAWPGFDWTVWQEISNAQRPDISSPQAGSPTLVPLLSTSADPSDSITTADAWESKRNAIKGRLSEILGEPTNLKVAPPNVKVGKSANMGTYSRTHLQIRSEPDDRIPAYYLRPHQSPDGPQPIMIVLHQTQAPGKREACGMTGDADMHFAKELVERGMACIVPDAIGFGERIPVGTQPYAGAHEFYKRHPQWSYFGKMSWDIARIIDYLETLPEVDPSRIGVIGHSHGAYGSIMGAVFEPRISLVVASCGFTTLRGDPRPDRWSHLTALMPRLGFYTDDIATAPFDWHEIVACIAPRPYYNWATLEDAIFPNTANLEDIYKQVGNVYALYDAKEKFNGRLAPGAHRFPVEERHAAYDWIEKHFQH